MKRIITFLWILTAAGLGSGGTALAQGLPKTQPKLITIVREEVKAGRNAEHSKHEAGWPAAFEKAKSPDYYLGITSLTGPNEAWYIIPFESHAALGESLKREDKGSLSASNPTGSAWTRARVTSRRRPAKATRAFGCQNSRWVQGVLADAP